MVFTKLGNDILVNNISLLYIKLNQDKKAIEYVLANRKKIVEKFDTLEEMYAAYEKIDTEGLIQLIDGYMLNAMRVETIESPKYDTTRIEYGFGILGKVTEKYNSAEEAKTAFDAIAKDNYIEIEDNYYLSKLSIDGLQKDSVNTKAVAYTLGSGKTIKAIYESSEAADSALETTVTSLESYEYVAPVADERNYLKITSATKTTGGDNTEDYYKNMDLITVTNTENTINVVATSPLNTFVNSVGMNNAWYGLLIDLGITRDKVVALKGYSFDSKETDTTEAQKWGATNDNQFILWLTGDVNQENRQIIFGASDNSVRPTIINISFTINPNLKEEMSIKDVATIDELKAVINDATVKTVNLIADIENINEVIAFANKVTLNGNGHKLQFTTTGQNLVFLQPSTVNNLVVESQGTDSWTSTYAAQVYNGQGYILNDVKFTGGNAGLLVNGATATVTNIDVSGNTFGGIEVSKGSLATSPSTLYLEGDVINTTEAYGKPTVWTDGEGQTVNGAEAMFTNSEVKEGQVQYYLLEENSRDNINVNLEQKLQAFKEKYYNKFSNKKITTSDADFDSSLVYTNLGNVNSTVDTITVNDETIDSTVVGVSIGNNAFLRAPLFKVEDNVLYVSTVLLVTFAVDEEIKVIAGDNTKYVKDSNIMPSTILPISNVYALNTKEGYTNTVQASDNNTVITQTAGYGTSAVGVTLQSNGEDILDSQVVYVYRTGLSIGISTPERMDNKDVTFAYYAKYMDSAYTEEETKEFNFVIYVPDSGIAQFNLTVNCIVETVDNEAEAYGISTMSLEPEVEATETTVTTSKKKNKRK